MGVENVGKAALSGTFGQILGGTSGLEFGLELSHDVHTRRGACGLSAGHVVGGWSIATFTVILRPCPYLIDQSGLARVIGLAQHNTYAARTALSVLVLRCRPYSAYREDVLFELRAFSRIDIRVVETSAHCPLR